MDLNERIAVWIGWKRDVEEDGSIWWRTPEGLLSVGDPPSFTTDHNAARLVLAEVERRALTTRFVSKLFKINWPRAIDDDPIDFWNVLNATPEQICEAAIAAGEVE